MTVQTLPKTKKERIKELLATGLDAKQIASELNTTADYVYKEKGKLKKKKLEVMEQSLSVSDGSHNITVLSHNGESINLDQNEIRNSINNDKSDYDIPPLDNNDVKSMYTEFMEGKNWAYVSAKYGIRPDISQREYLRCLTISSRDPLELQNRMLSRLSNPPAALQEIINKSVKGNLLTNDELLLIIDHYAKSYSSEFLKDIVAHPTIIIPSGLSRIECRLCHNLQAGVIYDDSTYAGNLTKKIVSTHHLCSNCKSLIQVAYEEFKHDHP